MTMLRGAVGNLDVAQLVLYAFFAFFAGLVYYLRREDRREGYPLASEAAGRLKARGFLLIPPPKTFRLADGRTVSKPDFVADTRPLGGEKTEPWPGAPIEPSGDAMTAGVGAGAYAMRRDETDKTHEGHDRIVPLRIAKSFSISPESPNPVGFTVVGADRRAAGKVVELWVDRGESFLRYYEVKLADAARTLMLPVNFSVVDARRSRIVVEALLADQFVGVPATKSADSITFLEEEKITAYYGAGTLYATPQRAEPLL
jgi:photosynthetic reaction center H subunit